MRLGVLLALVALAVPIAAAAQNASPAPATAVVRIPFPGDDGSLTPYTFDIGYPLVTLVYDTLLWHDGGGRPKPWLASSLDADAAATQITVHLTRGVRWQDGAPLSAGDVAFTFRYILAHPHPRFTPELAELAAVETPDAGTVILHLRRSSPGFAEDALTDIPILPQHIWDGMPAGQVAPDGLPVGSGPYRLVAHRPTEGYRFDANPDYFRGPPAVRTIDVPFIPDVEGTLQALRRREVDLIPVSPAGPARSRPKGIGLALLKGASFSGTDLVFNVRRPPFDHVEVRRAVSLALDLPRITSSVGDGVAADRGHIHPASPWAASGALHHFDEAAARRMLGAAGLPPLQVLAAGDDPVQREAGRQVALALQRVGLQAQLRELSRADLGGALGAGGAVPDFELAIQGSPAAVSAAPDRLGRIFAPGSEAAGLNPSGYHSPVLDAIVERVTTTTDPRARTAAVQEELRLLASDAPVVPLLFSNAVYAYRPGVYDGWVFVKGFGILDKLSFVEPRRLPASVAVTPGSSSPDLTVGRIALGLLALAVLLGGVAVVRRRE